MNEGDDSEDEPIRLTDKVPAISPTETLEEPLVLDEPAPVLLDDRAEPEDSGDEVPLLAASPLQSELPSDGMDAVDALLESFSEAPLLQDASISQSIAAEEDIVDRPLLLDRRLPRMGRRALLAARTYLLLLHPSGGGGTGQLVADLVRGHHASLHLLPVGPLDEASGLPQLLARLKSSGASLGVLPGGWPRLPGLELLHDLIIWHGPRSGDLLEVVLGDTRGPVVLPGSQWIDRRTERGVLRVVHDGRARSLRTLLSAVRQLVHQVSHVELVRVGEARTEELTEQGRLVCSALGLGCSVVVPGLEGEDLVGWMRDRVQRGEWVAVASTQRQREHCPRVAAFSAEPALSLYVGGA